MTLSTLRTCVFCERRPEDHIVESDGKLVPICDTCWQRALDETDRQQEHGPGCPARFGEGDCDEDA